MLDIKSKLQSINEGYEKIQKEKDELQKQISTISEEQLRLQGEFRVYVGLGQEMGIIDEQGKFIEQPQEESEVK